MNWFDIVALLLIVLIVTVESQRGFGRALFDLVGAIIAFKVASVLARPLAGAAPLLASPDSSAALWLGIVFVLLVTLTVIASKMLYETTLLSLDVLDPVVGALLGFCSGALVAHVFLKALLIAYGEGEAANAVLTSFMGQELLRFRSFHRIVTALQNLGNW